MSSISENLQQNRAAAQKNQRFSKKGKKRLKRGSHPYATEWRRYISDLDFAFNVPKHRFKTETIIEKYNKGKCPFQGISKENLLDHEAGITKIYFCNSHRQVSLAILIIDIDTHREGQTLAEAVRYVEFLASMPRFKSLYYELSTNGKGIHATLRVPYMGCSKEELKIGATNLARFLREKAESFNIDVEVRGQPPIVEYDDNGNIKSLTQGVLVRLPRNLKAALETATLTVPQLLSLPKPTRKEVPSSTSTTSKEPKYRSTSLITPAMLEYMPFLQSQIENYFVSNNLELPKNKNDRHKVTYYKIAVFLMLHHAMEPNKDFSLPRSRYQELWTELYKYNVIDCAFSPNIFSLIRNFLSQNGVIDWIDHRYQPPEMNEFGQRKIIGGNPSKGKCCRWKLSEKLEKWLSDLFSGAMFEVKKERHPSVPQLKSAFSQQNLQIPLKGSHQHRLPTVHNFGVSCRWAFQQEMEECLYAA